MFKIMSILESYENLPRPLKNQLNDLIDIYSNNEKVKTTFYDLLNEFDKKHPDITNTIKRKLFKYSIFKSFSTKEILESRHYNSLYCYSDDHEIITFNKLIKSGKHCVVLEGRLSNSPVIVKWYQSNKRDCTYESNIYKRLNDDGCDTPWFSSKFKFWNSPVLVLEKLHSLNQYDDEYKLGIHIIRQLKFLHKFGIHSDIKPQNIMKRISKSSSGKETVKYLLIDFGGVALDPLDYGYRRWIWSPKWTCQPMHKKNQIVTPKHDFLELAFTIKCIQNWRHSRGKTDGNCKEGFKGRLKKYFDHIMSLDHKSISDSSYSSIISIFKSK